MDRIYFTKKQARQFLLLKHGLLGDYKFVGKEGILSFIRQAGCIQFDPLMSVAEMRIWFYSPESKTIKRRCFMSFYILIGNWWIILIKIS